MALPTKKITKALNAVEQAKQRLKLKDLKGGIPADLALPVPSAAPVAPKTPPNLPRNTAPASINVPDAAAQMKQNLATMQTKEAVAAAAAIPPPTVPVPAAPKAPISVPVSAVPPAPTNVAQQQQEIDMVNAANKKKALASTPPVEPIKSRGLASVKQPSLTLEEQKKLEEKKKKMSDFYSRIAKFQQK